MLFGKSNWLVAISLLSLESVLPQAHAQEASAFTKASNESLLWGPYSPNLYFGIRPRIPKSVRASLLWARVDDFATVQQSERKPEQIQGVRC